MLYATGKINQDDPSAVLDSIADRLAAVENKPIAAAYAVAGLTAMSVIDAVSDWPLFGLVLSPAITVVGALAVAGAYVRYYVDGYDVESDACAALYIGS